MNKYYALGPTWTVKYMDFQTTHTVATFIGLNLDVIGSEYTFPVQLLAEEEIPDREELLEIMHGSSKPYTEEEMLEIVTVIEALRKAIEEHEPGIVAIELL